MAEGLPTASEKKSRLIDLYRQMYELTEPECRCSCLLPRSCCAKEHCEMAANVAAEMWDVDTAPLRTGNKIPFMGPDGCVLEPHLRPHCTVHTCDILSWGCKVRPAPDPEWDKKYWELRNEIDELSWEVFE